MDKANQSETDSQDLSGSEDNSKDQSEPYEKDNTLSKISKSSHGIARSKKSNKKARHRWYYFKLSINHVQIAERSKSCLIVSTMLFDQSVVDEQNVEAL